MKNDIQNVMRVFCDLDGVCADFEKHFLDIFGIVHSSILDDNMWAMITEIADEFWSTMPLKYGAHKLWDVVKPYNPTILTGCPKWHYDIAANHKVIWVKEHFGPDVPVITCLSRNKPLHMEAPGDLLIDDMSRNIKRWVKAGGIGVHYRTLEQAITDFKNIVDA